MRVFAIIFTIAIFSTSVFGGEIAIAGGTIFLLDGYRHEPGTGLDSSVGQIRSSAGLTIEYDVGGLSGQMASNMEPARQKWMKRSKIGDASMVVTMTLQNMVFVTLTYESANGRDHANFFATVNAPDDVADLLLIASSYRRAVSTPTTAPGKRGT